MTTVIAALAGANTINQMMHNVNKIRTGIEFSSNTAIRLPRGTTAQRPTAVAGAFRYNTQLSQFEGYTAEGWGSIGGGGLGVFKLIAGSYTANSGDRLAVSTTAAGRTITLPSSPSAEDIVEFIDKDSSFATNNLTISRNGSTIEGSSANLVADITSTNFFMQYTGSTWEVFGVGSGETTVGGDLTGLTSTATFSAAGIAKIALGNTNAQFAAKQNTLPVNFSTANLTAINLTATGTATINGNAIIGSGGVSSLFNAIGGSTGLSVTRSASSTNVLGNSNSSISIVNTDNTTNNTTGLHFAWQDTDGNPNYAGASIVVALGAKVGGQYPTGDMNFLTSTITNAAPSTKMTLDRDGDLSVEGTGVFKKGMPIRVAGGNNVVLALADNGKLLMCTNTAGAMSVRIPNNSAVAFPIGAEISLVNVLTHASANTLGIAQTAGVILQSKEAANTVADRFTSATLKKTATNTWLLIGNLA